MTTTTEPAWRTRYGPQQLRDVLGVTEWQHVRGTTSGVIPPPDAAGGKWSGDVVRELYPNRVAISRSVGLFPDVGEFRAAGYLTERVGFEVEPHAVADLARSGLILIVGSHKDRPLYCGRTLEAWPAERRDEIERANVAGERLIVDRVVDRLGVRRSDVDHLVALGWLAPVDMAHGPFTAKARRPDVPLYRAGDVTALLLSGDIDWDAVRAVSKGKRSPLATLQPKHTNDREGGQR